MISIKIFTGRILLPTINSFIFLLAAAPNAFSQATAPIVPDNLVAAEGRSVTVNISTGTRASLTVGTANAFGVSTSINSMVGAKSNSKASLTPQKGSISTSLGASATEGAPPSIQADIQNVRTIGSGLTNYSTNASTTGNITSEEDAQFAEGSTLLTGIKSDFEMDLDPAESSFTSNVDYDGAATDTVSITGSATSAANVNSNINVDISNTAFTSAFSSNF